MTQFPISVIIPTYNRAALLDQTLNSLALQQFSKNDFEVIVSDDGSTDETLEIVKRYAATLNMAYVYQEDKGYRPASARNRAIRIAGGKICVFMDCGVLAHENFLQAHWKAHASCPERISAVGYVYGFEFAHDIGKNILQEKLISCGDPTATIAYFKEQGYCQEVREPLYNKYNHRIHDLPAAWMFYWTCNVSVTTEDLRAMNMFDEAYDGRWGCEDNDLGLRLQQQGIKLIICREAEAIHYPHDNDGGVKLKQGEMNCLYFHKKFNTPATGLFLEYYNIPDQQEFYDINELLSKK
jgi:glycosyltransferase involved in cell wall biosynthesis